MQLEDKQTNGTTIGADYRHHEIEAQTSYYRLTQNTVSLSV